MGKLEVNGTNRPEWIAAHEDLCSLGTKRAALDHEEGRVLLRARRACVHEHFGYGTFAEYVGRWLGHGFHSVEEKLRVAEALESLPQIDDALASGRVSWSAARELTRVATAETEGEWLKAAAGQTVRQLERAVSGRERGDLPTSTPKPELKRHVLRFEVSGETLATFREALERLRQRDEERLDEEAALLLMARESLAGSRNADAPGYQISLTTCDQCQRSFQLAKGELVEVAPSVVDQARCDGASSHVGATTAIPRAVRREVFRRDRGCCVVPGCRNSVYLDLHHIDLRSEGGLHEPDNLVVVCGAHHGALHRGALQIRGSVSTGLRFLHADGTPYGHAPSAPHSHVGAGVFGALRALGFSERKSRWAIGQCLATADAARDPRELLRAAIAAATHSRRSSWSAAP
jgi:hypothetical protein